MKFKLILLSFLTVLSVTSQEINKDSLLKRDIVSVKAQLTYMTKLDQMIRLYENYKTFDYHLKDSIDDLPLEQRIEYRDSLPKDSITQSMIFTDMRINDSLNVLRLIKIVNKYGYPSGLRIVNATGTSCYIHPVSTIFVHAPSQYFEQIGDLCEQEYLENRIPESDYKHILWHLSGRKDNIPEFMNKSIDEILKGE